jgi:hypothetical protein
MRRTDAPPRSSASTTSVWSPAASNQTTMPDSPSWRRSSCESCFPMAPRLMTPSPLGDQARRDLPPRDERPEQDFASRLCGRDETRTNTEKHGLSVFQTRNPRFSCFLDRRKRHSSQDIVCSSAPAHHQADHPFIGQPTQKVGCLIVIQPAQLHDIPSSDAPIQTQESKHHLFLLHPVVASQANVVHRATCRTIHGCRAPVTCLLSVRPAL